MFSTSFPPWSVLRRPGQRQAREEWSCPEVECLWWFQLCSVSIQLRKPNRWLCFNKVYSLSKETLTTRILTSLVLFTLSLCSVSYDQNQSNQSTQSKLTQTKQWTSQKSNCLHTADVKRGKMSASESRLGLVLLFIKSILTSLVILAMWLALSDAIYLTYRTIFCSKLHLFLSQREWDSKTI